MGRCVGGIRMSTIATSGCSSATNFSSPSASAAHYVDASIGEQSSEPRPDQHDVVGNYDPHGITAVTTVLHRLGRGSEVSALWWRPASLGSRHRL